MEKFPKLPALTTGQMMEVDRLMIEEWGITLIQMMENAGLNLAELSRRLLQDLRGKRIIVLCGVGNNGGGGMVAVRHLHNWGAQVQVILVVDEHKLKEIPLHQWKILKRMGLNIPISDFNKADLILDAMLGYGVKGNPREPIASWIHRVNESKIPVLALDAPSGLDTTTGKPGSPCLRAHATLTLALPKTGLLTPDSKPFVGDLYLADISVPVELYGSASLKLT
ncbi:MAG TPA: NAD(P)H-hydrate epimerase, partial [Anaerolineales bacterium]|nr:NAD(P)H-hydrate epimerase [Anaerolineales bacterium]